MKNSQILMIWIFFCLIVQITPGPVTCVSCVLTFGMIMCATCGGAAYACLLGTGPFVVQCLVAACGLAA